MQRTLVLTLIGSDRPGLVEKVASLVAAHGGNWLESRMCRLGGEFAGILRAAFPEGENPPLADALQALASEGLSVTWKADAPAGPGPGPRAIRLALIGQDRPGIVKEISGALARAGANVEDLSTECSSAPMSGETLFRADLLIRLPAGCDEDSLRAELERVADDLLVDMTLAPAGEED